MLAGRPAKAITVSISLLVGIGAALALTVGSASAGTGPGASGNTITNALQAQTPFSPGTLDSGQPVDVVVPANSILTPGATIFVLECSAPGGVDPTTINSCDGNTGYAGGTISVNGDGSIDVINTSTSSGLPYIIYALPDSITLAEGSSGPKCGLGSANECVLYIGQGGGSDTGLSQPHFFSQAFQVHPDPTDSGKLNPGDGTFAADSAPAITSANHTTFIKGTAGTFTVTASGYGPPTFTETGALPTGVTLKTTFSGTSSTGVLAGTPTQSGTFPITITATNGVGSPAIQSFTLTVNGPATAPAITSANHTTFTEGTAGTFTVTATGSPTPTLAESGTLPTGVTFTPGTGKLAGTPTQSGTFPITFTATNEVGSPAHQSFTLTVNPSGSGPAITLHRTTDLVGNESVAVSGTGWGADSMVTLSECTSPTFSPSSCDPNPSSAGARVAALEQDHRPGAGGRIRSHITLVVGVVGSKKRTCGLSSSGPCYIVAVGNTGDSASSGPLRFSVPHFTLKHTQGLLGNTVDKVEGSGFPIGDNVIAAECDPQVHVPKTVVSHCDQANSIQGSPSSHGRVAFTPTAITLLVGSAFTDSAHRKCPAGGTCEIVVTDSDNPAIGLVAPITFAKPSVSLEASTNVSPNFKDRVDASGFPVGDGVIAQECDQSVHVPKTIGTHCDAATSVSGTVGSKGVVSFSPSAVTVLVGSAYVDSSHHSCIPGGTCQVVVVDTDNSNVAVGVPVGLAP
jgi:Putative Ig domain/Neocarzinostatin family